jgi:signal transduction histidine kinase
MSERLQSDLSVERARRLQTFAAAVAAAVVVLGLFVLFGWTIDGPPLLKGALLTDVTMKANTALCLVLVGVSLFITALRPDAPHWRYVSMGAAGVAGLVGALTLSQHIVGWNLHIDQLLFVEEPNELGTASPGRMGPPASTSFTLLGIALILLQLGTRQAVIAQYLASVTILIAIPGILGHLYGAELLYALARVSGIALPTGVALVSLGLGVLATRPDAGLTRLFVAEDPGGAVLRRLILPSAAFFIFLGWAASSAQTLEWVDGRFAAAVEVAVLIVFLVILGIDSAKAMNAVARGRDIAERERERLLESERAARTEAERAARTKDDFLATISHELRTPLSGILGWTHVLQRVDDPETRRQALEAIERGARAQAKLIDDLLDVSSVV